jgi:hypothetical protein
MEDDSYSTWNIDQLASGSLKRLLQAVPGRHARITLPVLESLHRHARDAGRLGKFLLSPA